MFILYNLNTQYDSMCVTWIHIGQNLATSIHNKPGIGVPRCRFMGTDYQKHVHYVYGLFMKKIETHKKKPRHINWEQLLSLMRFVVFIKQIMVCQYF